MAQLRVLSLYLTARCRTERGASLVEYALLVALIAMVCVTAVTAFGGATNRGFQSMNSRF